MRDSRKERKREEEGRRRRESKRERERERERERGKIFIRRPFGERLKVKLQYFICAF